MIKIGMTGYVTSCRDCAKENLKVGVTQDWKNRVIVSLYKGKDKAERTRGISLWSIVGKVHGRILIDCVRRLIDEIICEEQVAVRAHEIWCKV